MTSSMKYQCAISTLLVVFSASFLSCRKSQPTSPNAAVRFEGVIPRPVTSTPSGKTFFLTADTRIVADPAVEGSTAVGSPPSGEGASRPGGEGITYRGKVGDSELGREGWGMPITEDQVTSAGREGAGVFYGVQTRRRWLPGAIERDEPQQASGEVA